MRSFTRCIAIAVALITTGLTAAHVAGESALAVGIEDFTFTPPVLTVPAGTTVTWTNHDEETHTITSVAGAFGSGGLAHEEHFAQVFPRPGRYEYFCALHPHMKAVVIVR